MKTVLLLGDSIRMQYQAKVAEKLLPKDIAVYGPHDNCRFSKHMLWCMYYWVKEDFRIKHFDMIHLNAGIWDVQRATADNEIFTPIDEYAENCRRIILQAKQYADKVVWATTTPGGSALHDDTPILARQDVWNSDISKYNVAALNQIQSFGDVLIDDLHSCVSDDIDTNICEDGLHLSDRGIDKVSDQVSQFILKNI